MTSYALSLIMNRRLLIRMTKPCTLENYLEPNEINWLPNITNLNQMTTYYLHINWRGKINESSFSQINFINFFPSTDVITITTNMQLIKHLTINRKHHKRIKELGFSLDNFNLEYVIDKWYKKLFKFNSKLNDEYEKYMKMLKPTTETKLICAQIRLFRYSERKNVPLFWNFIKEKLIKRNLNGSDDYKVFVTSDRPYVIDESKKMFGEHAVGRRANSFHLNYVSGQGNKCESIMKLIFDFKALGQCDMAVVSHSGFGMIGVLNRANKNYTNLYVHSNPSEMAKQFWNRVNLSFVEFQPSLFYLEFMGGNI